MSQRYGSFGHYVYHVYDTAEERVTAAVAALATHVASTLLPCAIKADIFATPMPLRYDAGDYI